MEHPEKYPDSVVFFGSAPTGLQRTEISRSYRFNIKLLSAMTPRRKKSDFSEKWRLSRAVQFYHHVLAARYPGHSNPHAAAVALTLDGAGLPSVGVYDNGRKKVLRFDVLEFARVLRSFWDVYFFNITVTAK